MSVSLSGASKHGKDSVLRHSTGGAPAGAQQGAAAAAAAAADRRGAGLRPSVPMLSLGGGLAPSGGGLGGLGNGPSSEDGWEHAGSTKGAPMGAACQMP